MVKSIFLRVSVIITLLVGVSGYVEYYANHTYYTGMFNDSTNLLVLLSAVIATLIPICYLSYFQKKRLFGLVISILVGYLLFGLSTILLKEQLYGAGFLMFIVNMTLMFALIIYFILALTSVGTYIKNKIFHQGELHLRDIIISFGLGLVTFLVVNHLLIYLGLFYGIVVWAIFILGGVSIYQQKNNLLHYESYILNILNRIGFHQLKHDPYVWISIILTMFSLAYFYYGYMMSFIPYPTAWDANHAYLYVPKVFSLYNGFMWSEIQGLSIQPLWMGYIAFWFKLFHSFPLWIAADTFAVVMNFLSGVFALILGLSLITEVMRFIDTNRKIDEVEEGQAQKYGFYIGRFVFLLWLTSGMGAFLIFVDNKTDLGVMSLVLLGMFTGFTFLNTLQEKEEKSHITTSTIMKYLIISGVFFGIAMLAKPTAGIDVGNFAIMLSFLRFGRLTFLGVSLFIVGGLAIAKILGIHDFLSVTQGRYLGIAGGIMALSGLGLAFIRNQVKYIKYLFFRGGAILLTILLVKGGFVVTAAIKTHNYHPSDIVKTIFLGSTQGTVNKKVLAVNKQRPKILLASTSRLASAISINGADGEALSGVTIETTPVDATAMVPESCSLDALKLSTGDLYNNLTEPPVSNEDLGRYVGYGQKEFLNPWRKLFVGGMDCFSWDPIASVLCENKELVSNGDRKNIHNLLKDISPSTEGYSGMMAILNTDAIKSVIDGQTTGSRNEFLYEINQIEQYYKDKAFQVTDTSVFIPYTYLVPFNVVFNWSLQNLSSYYTDIGFVWLPIFFLLVIAFIYAMIKRDIKFLSLTGATIVGRGIWRLIGSAIIWYGIGMIIWSVLSLVAFFYHMRSQKEGDKIAYYGIIVLLVVMGIVQLVMNFVRMSSQTAGGPFLRYKSSNGTKAQTSELLAYTTKDKYGYNADDVLALQFPHYSHVVALSDARSPEQYTFIAGTYIQYFLANQKKLFMDGGLTSLTKWFSDGDACRSYLRLKDKNMKYLIIDPNIGSIVMGGGNATLFERFFAKINPINGTIERDGTMTMLVKLIDKGYIKLLYSNNLGAKYAFGLDPMYLQAKIGVSDPDALVLMRARLATARFWQNSEQFIQLIVGIFGDRMVNGDAIGDIADIIGKNIDAVKLKKIAGEVMQSLGSADKLKQIATPLSEDERFVLLNYISLYQQMQSKKSDFMNSLQQLVGQSIGGGSQLIVFELP